jgi:hypothetical protein
MIVATYLIRQNTSVYNIIKINIHTVGLQMNVVVYVASQQIKTTCSSLDSVCPNTNNTCFVNANGSITCVDKCALFMSTEDKCDGNWVDNVVYLEGHCVYDDVNNARCE